MSATTQILLRATRDRVVDLLGIGETYPLQDVPVSADRLTVTINTTAKISIDPGQSDVTYTLRDRNDKSVSSDTVGTGAATILVTPAITEDQTFRIFASKSDAFASGIKRQDYLTQVAEVKVGLNTTLNAYIDAPLLNPKTDSGAASDPRIVDYGSNVTVKVEQSQEGVDYSLVVVSTNGETVVSQNDVRGNLGTVVLTSTPILRDMSTDGFRGSFLLRQGLLSARDGVWLLRVERETYDVVLDRFPWSIDWVKLPWMEVPLGVEW